MDCSGFIGKIELIEDRELFVFFLGRCGRAMSRTTLFLLGLDVVGKFAESLDGSGWHFCRKKTRTVSPRRRGSGFIGAIGYCLWAEGVQYCI
jgi:hypothetical protein